MDEVQLEVLSLDLLAIKNQPTEQITNIEENIEEMKELKNIFRDVLLL